MSKLFFTADLHLGHANIIRYCNRPFKDIKDMNLTIIRKWNERVKPEDNVFHVGDFCFKSAGKTGNGQKHSAEYWRNHLNGNIVFLKGNHDRNNSLKTKIRNLTLNIDNKLINVVHNPERANFEYDINFVGHVHNNWKIKRIKRLWNFTDCINVGVDVWDFYPVTYHEIMKRYTSWLKGSRL